MSGVLSGTGRRGRLKVVAALLSASSRACDRISARGALATCHRGHPPQIWPEPGRKPSHSWSGACNLFTCRRASVPRGAHMSRDATRISIYSNQREKTPLSRTPRKVRFTNASCRHTFMIFPRVDLSRAAPSPGSPSGD